MVDGCYESLDVFAYLDLHGLEAVFRGALVRILLDPQQEPGDPRQLYRCSLHAINTPDTAKPSGLCMRLKEALRRIVEELGARDFIVARPTSIIRDGVLDLEPDTVTVTEAGISTQGLAAISSFDVYPVYGSGPRDAGAVLDLIKALRRRLAEEVPGIIEAIAEARSMGLRIGDWLSSVYGPGKVLARSGAVALETSDVGIYLRHRRCIEAVLPLDPWMAGSPNILDELGGARAVDDLSKLVLRAVKRFIEEMKGAVGDLDWGLTVSKTVAVARCSNIVAGIMLESTAHFSGITAGIGARYLRVEVYRDRSGKIVAVAIPVTNLIPINAVGSARAVEALMRRGLLPPVEGSGVAEKVVTELGERCRRLVKVWIHASTALATEIALITEAAAETA